MKTFDITISIDNGYGYGTVKTLKNLYLKECFEALTDIDLMVKDFPEDLGEFMKGINYSITESKEVK